SRVRGSKRNRWRAGGARTRVIAPGGTARSGHGDLRPGDHAVVSLRRDPPALVRKVIRRTEADAAVARFTAADRVVEGRGADGGVAARSDPLLHRAGNVERAS